MREMLESKVILAFIFIILGIVCINIPSIQLEEETPQEYVYNK